MLLTRRERDRLSEIMGAAFVVLDSLGRLAALFDFSARALVTTSSLDRAVGGPTITMSLDNGPWWLDPGCPHVWSVMLELRRRGASEVLGAVTVPGALRTVTGGRVDAALTWQHIAPTNGHGGCFALSVSPGIAPIVPSPETVRAAARLLARVPG